MVAMSPPPPRRSALMRAIVVATLLGPSAAAAQREAVPVPEWRVLASGAATLWFHGVALTGFGAGAPAVLYDPGYATRVRSDRARRGIAPTALERAAPELRRTLRADPAFDVIHFIPLHLADDDWPPARDRLRALLQDAPASAGPNRGPAPAARAMARALPTAAQRRLLRHFIDLLDDDWRTAARDEQRREEDAHATVAQALARLWNDEYLPALAPHLAARRQLRGTILLSSALGPEGRTAAREEESGPAIVVAIGAPGGAPRDAARDGAADVLRELCFATVHAVETPAGDAPRDADAAEQASRTAAVRCGALVLGRYLPRYRAMYEAHFVARTQGNAGATSGSAFARLFPLPPDVERALVRAIGSR